MTNAKNAVAPIRILAKGANARGDLFTTLMQAFFGALGYERFRLNVQKSGREIDLSGIHRTESKQVRAECKATAERVGGDEINKFVGALDAERRKSGADLVGYFVSLSGFKGTAVEQEEDCGNSRVILVDGSRICNELVTGRIAVPISDAFVSAGKCASEYSDLHCESEYELLAHRLGFIWAVFFSKNKLRTHYSLIHADGEALAPELAQEVSSSAGTLFHQLTYLAPPPAVPCLHQKIQAARASYLNYLSNELGVIQLEGMPADQEVGAKKLRLESIFVPSHLSVPVGLEQEVKAKNRRARESLQRVSAGEVLRRVDKLAILGLPGSGKSTLLKRIAIAYAFPDRKKLIDDGLPDLDVLPIFIRCRQLGTLVRAPILEAMRSISAWMEVDIEVREGFAGLISDALRAGKALLLVDGIDEIADEGDRAAFVSQLQTFIARYPGVKLILTSREAGFRIVSRTLSSSCTQYVLADFDDNDIEALVVAWHKEVIGDRPDVVSDAYKLARSICASQRVRQLAQNPLLLTTLLLVKRWVSRLPTKRTALYAKAIEVLLMTWNVEGHEPLDQEEVLPQLEYLAFTMMKQGIQRVSLSQLHETFNRARQDMPEALGYCKISVAEMVKRVESRSSLLMLSGHDIEDGIISPMYEFRHLTFQEYLTAKAIVDGCYPGRMESDSVLSILQPHLLDENWSEVILLASVLSGRRVAELIKYLLNEIDGLRAKSKASLSAEPFATLLASCIADEAQIPPEALNECFRALIPDLDNDDDLCLGIARSKYGDAFEAACKQAFSDPELNTLDSGGLLALIAMEKWGWNVQNLGPEVTNRIEGLISSGDWYSQCLGALSAMQLAYKADLESKPDAEPDAEDESTRADFSRLKSLAGPLSTLLSSPNYQVRVTAAWALCWLGQLWPDLASEINGLFSTLLSMWRTSKGLHERYVAAWAINVMNPKPREEAVFGRCTPELVRFLMDVSEVEKVDAETEEGIEQHAQQIAAIVVGYYLGAEFATDQELVRMIDRRISLQNRHTFFTHAHAIRERLSGGVE